MTNAAISYPRNNKDSNAVSVALIPPKRPSPTNTTGANVDKGWYKSACVVHPQVVLLLLGTTVDTCPGFVLSGDAEEGLRTPPAVSM